MEPSTNHQPTIVHQLVINQSFEGLKDWLHIYLDEHTDRWLARQHPADEDVNRTHVHYMLVNPTVTKQSIAKFLNKNHIEGSDMFGHLTVTKKGKKPYDEDILGEYIMKGKPIGEPDMPIHYNNYTEGDIKTFICGWVSFNEKVTQIEPKEDKDTVEKQYERIKIKAIEYFKEHSQIELYTVRKFCVKEMISKTGLFPNPSAYKRIAVSIFYYLRQHHENHVECVALDEIIEWNY